jgi:hypothetical protein
MGLSAWLLAVVGTAHVFVDLLLVLLLRSGARACPCWRGKAQRLASRVTNFDPVCKSRCARSKKAIYGGSSGLVALGFVLVCAPALAVVEFGVAQSTVFFGGDEGCASAGGDPGVTNNSCVFPTGEIACKVRLEYYNPYSVTYDHWDNDGFCFVVDPGATAPRRMDGFSNVARCSPGSPRYDYWFAYTYGVNPPDASICTADTPPKNKGDSCPATANPIHTATGNKWQNETDFSGTGSSLTFTRYFNLIEPQAKANLGYGWTHTYARWVNASSVLPKATIRRHDGKEYVFNFNSTSSTWIADADIVERLVERWRGRAYRLALHHGKRRYRNLRRHRQTHFNR